MERPSLLCLYDMQVSFLPTSRPIHGSVVAVGLPLSSQPKGNLVRSVIGRLGSSAISHTCLCWRSPEWGWVYCRNKNDSHRQDAATERPAGASSSGVHAMVRSRYRNATGDHQSDVKSRDVMREPTELRLISVRLELGRGLQCHTSILISSSARSSNTRAA